MGAGENVSSSFVEDMSGFDFSDDAIKKIIEKLNVSADTKALLYSFSKATIRIGDYVLKVGRKIIDFVCIVFKEYPSATFGLIFGGIAGFLISSIPIIGAVLGPIFTPIALALGLASGVWNDIKDKNLNRRIEEINAKFSHLNT